MPNTCSAHGCSNRSKSNDGLSFFRFPLKNPTILKRWLHVIKRKDFTPSLHSKICSEHFLPSDYLDRPGSYIRRLKPDAVPSVFSALPLGYQSVARKPRRILQQVIKQEPLSEGIDEDCIDVNHVDVDFVDVDRVDVDFVDADRVDVDFVDVNRIDTNIDNISKVDQGVQTDKVNSLDHTVLAMKHKIRILQQKDRRQQCRITNLKTLIKSLKKNRIVDS